MNRKSIFDDSDGAPRMGTGILAVICLILIAYILMGCTTTDLIKNRGSQFYDEALIASKTWTCNDTSVGSIVRAYGSSKAQMDAWLQYCFGDREVPFKDELIQVDIPPVPKESSVERTTGPFLID